MRRLGAVLVGMLSACGHGPAEPLVTRVPDFCCTAENCCGVRYYDADGGAHVQGCRTPAEVKPQNSKAGFDSPQSWLLRDAAAPAEASPRRASASTICPEETHWDGLSCAHVRVTCGGWNGISCDNPSDESTERERAAEIEFAAIAADATTVCPEDDESKQAYTGTATDVLKTLDATTVRADEIHRRLRELRETHPTPRWIIATLAKGGSVYDCIWNSLRQAHPTTYFTPQQLAVLNNLNNLNKLQQQLNLASASGASQFQAQTANARQAIIDKWNLARESYLIWLEARMVPDYVNAVLLARRYALEGSTCARACQRLPDVIRNIGDEKVAPFMPMIDPTDPQPDPNKRRHLVYFAGAFKKTP